MLDQNAEVLYQTLNVLQLRFLFSPGRFSMLTTIFLVLSVRVF